MGRRVEMVAQGRQAFYRAVRQYQRPVPLTHAASECYVLLQRAITGWTRALTHLREQATDAEVLAATRCPLRSSSPTLSGP